MHAKVYSRCTYVHSLHNIFYYQIEEIAESHDGSHYYDELPCNTRKDAHTGENAYQAGEDSSVCMYMHKGVVLSLSIYCSS